MASSLRALLNPKGKAKPPRNLRDQIVTPASVATKIRATYLAVAMLDALGNPLQGLPRARSRIIDEMTPHPTAGRAAGVWTDDTSMMLCVSEAIVDTEDPEENRVEQMVVLRRWKETGYLSCLDVCFDIKPQVKDAIELYGQNTRPDHALHVIRSTYCGDNDVENNSASLPRALPVGISFWREPDQAIVYGKLNSEITHPSLVCKEASALIAMVVALILEKQVIHPWRNPEEEAAKKMSKLTIVDAISRMAFQNNLLHDYLTPPIPAGKRPDAEDELESWYFAHIHLLRKIAKQQVEDPNPNPSFPFTLPSNEDMETRDHAFDVVLAALYCFFTTKNFEEGALMAVNLGGESSTIGAVYASIAAPFYVGEEEKDKLFWTKKVREWRKALQRQNVIEAQAQKMIGLAHRRLEEERQMVAR